MRANGVRTLVITGGNRGIGAEIAKRFAEEGYRVVVGARRKTPFLAQLGERVRFQPMDVRFEKGHERLAKAALAWTGHIDVYINCAGSSGWSPIGKVTESFLDAMIDTNLKGVLWGCKTAARYLSAGGCIINISSLAGKRGSANNSVYCAAKFGVNGITQALAKELGPKNIRVNAVCPVYVETDGVVGALRKKDSPAQGKNVKEYLRQFAAANAAMLRLPKAEEVAGTCLFLASTESSAITGQCVNVDCGVMPQ